jgi:hypothetical protein
MRGKGAEAAARVTLLGGSEPVTSPQVSSFYGLRCEVGQATL